MSLSLSYRFGPLAAALTCTIALTACANVTAADISFSNYGAVTITGKNAPAGRATPTVNAVFFRGLSANAPNSALQQGDQCSNTVIDSSTGAGTGSLRAGDNLLLTIAGTNVVMPFSSARLRYEQSTDIALTYAAGDAATLTVPGAAGIFPAASISVKLAEPIFPGPFVIPADGSPLNVSWNATNDATAAIIVSVAYGATPTATVPNRQIYCTLKDDGAFQVPAAALGAFLASPSALRSVTLLRWRTQEVRPSDVSLLHVVSTVDTIVRFP